MNRHLKTHDVTPKEYIEKYGEYRLKYLDYNKRSKQNNFICKVCSKKHASHQHLMFHIRIDHKLTIKKYVKKYMFNDVSQLCKCGCGEEVKYYSKFPYKSTYQ